MLLNEILTNVNKKFTRGSLSIEISNIDYDSRNIKEDGLYNKWGHMIGNGVKDFGVDIIEWQAVLPKEDIEIDDWKNLKVSYAINYNMDYSNEKGAEIASGRQL